MNYELIYYRSSATAEIQHITEKNLSDTGLKLSDAYAAAAPGELADRLSAAVRKVKLIFIVSEQSGENVLKKILSPKKEANSKTRITIRRPRPNKASTLMTQHGTDLTGNHIQQWLKFLKKGT